MDLRLLFFLSFAWILTFLPCIKPQVGGCSFGGTDIAGCLDQGINYIPDNCCSALNQAVEASFECLCLFISSFNPLFSKQLLFPLSSCFISVPPLAQCPATLAKLHTPSSPVPLLLPPANPVPLLHPPASPVPLLHPPASPTPLLLPPVSPVSLLHPPASPVPSIFRPGINGKPPQPPPPENWIMPKAPEGTQVPGDFTHNNNSSMVATPPSQSDSSQPYVIMVYNGYREDTTETLLIPGLLLAIFLYSFLF